MTFDPVKIKELLALIKDTDICKIEVRDGEQSILLERFSQKSEFFIEPPPRVLSIPNEPATQSFSDGHVVHAPMIGVIYLAPAPNADNFVEIGQTVKKGQVLCIIEAMKMMNHIEADCDGVLKQSLVKNNEPVEFGQPLFVIE